MPELAEIRSFAGHVNKHAEGRVFSSLSQSDVAKRKQKHDVVEAVTARLHDGHFVFRLSAEAQGKEMCLCVRFEAAKETVLATPQPVYVRFRFGMLLLPSFVDQRQFGRYEIVSAEQKYSADRSPDPIAEFPSFLDHIGTNLSKAVFNKPICEVLLEQKFFNGIGNYLRAEILHRAGVRPFERARDVLVKALKEERKGNQHNVLRYCKTVTEEAIALDVEYKTSDPEARLRFKNWLQVYSKRARRAKDGKGRMIWFQGEAGPLFPGGEIVENEFSSDGMSDADTPEEKKESKAKPARRKRSARATASSPSSGEEQTFDLGAESFTADQPIRKYNLRRRASLSDLKESTLKDELPKKRRRTGPAQGDE